MRRKKHLPCYWRAVCISLLTFASLTPRAELRNTSSTSACAADASSAFCRDEPIKIMNEMEEGGGEREKKGSSRGRKRGRGGRGKPPLCVGRSVPPYVHSMLPRRLYCISLLRSATVVKPMHDKASMSIRNYYHRHLLITVGRHRVKEKRFRCSSNHYCPLPITLSGIATHPHHLYFFSAGFASQLFHLFVFSENTAISAMLHKL